MTLNALTARLVVLFVFARMSCAADWPQLQRDAARTGWTPDSPAPPYEVAYALQFGIEEPLGQQMQPIVCRDILYVPTMRGRLYAFNPETGDRLWATEGMAPVFGTAAAAEGLIITAGLDGNVRAAQADSGRPAWETDLGFGISASPCVLDKRIYIGARNGGFFCLEAETGGIVWQIHLPGYVWSSAAAVPSTGSGQGNGRVYVSTDGEIRLYCLDAADGSVVWRSEQLPGMYVRDYYPVVSAGKVWTTVCPAEYNFIIEDPAILPYGHWFGEGEKEKVREYISELREGRLPDDFNKANDNLVAAYTLDPLKQHMFCFDTATGERPFVVGYKRVLAGMCHAAPPPAVDSEGMMVVAVSFGAARAGRIDPFTGRIADVIVGEIKNIDNPNFADGFGTNSDERHMPSCGGDRIYWKHGGLGGCDTSLMYDVKTRQAVALPGSVANSRVIWASLEPKEEYFSDKYAHWAVPDYPRLIPRGETAVVAAAIWRDFLFMNDIALGTGSMIVAIRGQAVSAGGAK